MSQEELLKNILLYISNISNKDEQTIAFGLINHDVLEYVKTNNFDKFLRDSELKKNCKQIVGNKDIKLQAVVHINLDIKLEHKQYKIYIHLLAPIQDYCEAIIKHKIKKFLKYAGLSYIKIDLLESLINLKYKTIYEVGQKHVGKAQSL